MPENPYQSSGTTTEEPRRAVFWPFFVVFVGGIVVPPILFYSVGRLMGRPPPFLMELGFLASLAACSVVVALVVRPFWHAKWWWLLLLGGVLSSGAVVALSVGLVLYGKLSS